MYRGKIKLVLILLNKRYTYVHTYNLRWNPMGPAELPPLEVRGIQEPDHVRL